MNTYKSSLASMFHNFPHLDFNFQNTTTVFTPDNIAYQQALSFNGVYLLFIAICLFLIFGFYFLVASCYFYGNCSSQVLKPRPSRSRCFRILIGLSGICSSAALGFAFYGNNKSKDGIEAASHTALDIYVTFDFFKFQNNDIISEALDSAEKELLKLENKIPIISNQSMVLFGEVNRHLTNASNLLSLSGNLLKDMGLDLQYYAEKTIKYDDIRWGVFTAFLCVHLLLVLVILYATYTNRKCAIIGLTLLAVFSLLLVLTIISVSVPLSIGAGDICCEPEQAYLQYIHNPAAKVLVEYYMRCEPSQVDNLLFETYNRTEQQLQAALTVVHNIQNIPFIGSLPEFKQLLSHTKDSLLGLNNLKEKIVCTAIHENYQHFLQAICTTTLEGFGLLILGCLAITLFLMCIMACITPLWKAIAPLRPILKKYQGVQIVTESYQGPPGYGGVAGSESFHGSSSFDASYKSIDDPEEFEHVPLISKRSQPQMYRAVHGSTEFLSVEEDRRVENRL